MSLGEKVASIVHGWAACLGFMWAYSDEIAQFKRAHVRRIQP